MKIIPIDDLHDSRLTDFTNLTDVELRKQREPRDGLYIAESTKVIQRALLAGHQPRSVLLTPQWLKSLEADLHEYRDVNVFVGSENQLEALTGFHLHRGALASMLRPKLPSPEQLLATASRIVVLEGLTDHTNVGAVFRSVAALGADAILVTESCADPLYRRSVRVSMGAVLQIPWTRIQDLETTAELLHHHGFSIICFALEDASTDLRTYAEQTRKADIKQALVFGSEGPGLTRSALNAADAIVRIPMHQGVDSLNVATAAGIVLWTLGKH